MEVKRIGVWMDHATARLMEYTSDDFKVDTIKSDMEGLDNQDALQHSESCCITKRINL